MQRIVTKYITKNTRIPENQSLKRITDDIFRTDKATFTHWLESWHDSNKLWLAEKRYNETTHKYEFIHMRTRQAYNALKRFLPYIFT